MSVVVKETERHVINRGLDSKSGEQFITSFWNKVQSYVHGPHIWIIVGIFVILGVIAIFYSLTGKGTGSHAGREEVRRSYRRELARQMARQDAEKIKRGEKDRKRWMQW